MFSISPCFIGNSVTFDNLSFPYGVAEISLHLARGRQLLHKLKASTAELVAYIITAILTEQTKSGGR